MSFFKKRSGAVVIFLLVVVLASFFAANRSLSQKVQEISDLFSDGVYDSTVGYKQPGIKKQLEARKDASMNLISIGAKYEQAKSETEALREARNFLVNGLANSMGPGKLYDADVKLQTSFDALYSRLSALPLSEGDRSFADAMQKEMTGAARMIEKSGYNEAVREFNRKVLSVFPTNIIKNLVFVKGPEFFE